MKLFIVELVGQINSNISQQCSCENRLGLVLEGVTGMFHRTRMFCANHPGHSPGRRRCPWRYHTAKCLLDHDPHRNCSAWARYCSNSGVSEGHFVIWIFFVYFFVCVWTSVRCGALWSFCTSEIEPCGTTVCLSIMSHCDLVRSYKRTIEKTTKLYFTVEAHTMYSLWYNKLI